MRRITTRAALLASVLASFLLVAACTIGAGELLRLAERPDGSTAVDGSITSWAVAHREHAVTTLARWLSAIGGTAVLLPAIAVAAFALLRRRRLVLAGLLVFAWGGAVGLYSLAKFIVGRHRPPSDIWLTKAAGASFPSGHATGSLAAFAAFALVAAVVVPRLRRPTAALALVLALGVGWSRVYLGVHWATDIGLGWVVAAAWIALVARLAQAASSIERKPTGVP